MNGGDDDSVIITACINMLPQSSVQSDFGFHLLLSSGSMEEMVVVCVLLIMSTEIMTSCRSMGKLCRPSQKDKWEEWRFIGTLAKLFNVTCSKK